MRWLIRRHPPIPARCRYPRLLSPQQQRHGKQQDHEAQDRDQNMRVLHVHAVYPGCEYEQHDDGEDVACEDYAYEGVADDLLVDRLWLVLVLILVC